MPTLSTARRNAACDSTVDALDAGTGAGKLRIYSGSKPAGPDTAIGAQVLLGEFTLNDPAFDAAGTAGPGIATLDIAPALSTTGLAAGEATWFRALDSDNVAHVDGTVGTSGADLIMNTTTVSVGLTLNLTSGTITQPA
jgi:hypothetical protein